MLPRIQDAPIWYKSYNPKGDSNYKQVASSSVTEIQNVTEYEHANAKNATDDLSQAELLKQIESNRNNLGLVALEEGQYGVFARENIPGKTYISCYIKKDGGMEFDPYSHMLNSTFKSVELVKFTYADSTIYAFKTTADLQKNSMLGDYTFQKSIDWNALEELSKEDESDSSSSTNSREDNSLPLQATFSRLFKPVPKETVKQAQAALAPDAAKTSSESPEEAQQSTTSQNTQQQTSNQVAPQTSLDGVFGSRTASPLAQSPNRSGSSKSSEEPRRTFHTRVF